MKVVAITTFDDYKTGSGPTAVIELPEGVHEDEVYLHWHNKEYETTWSRADLDREQAAGHVEDAWATHDVETLTVAGLVHP